MVLKRILQTTSSLGPLASLVLASWLLATAAHARPAAAKPDASSQDGSSQGDGFTVSAIALDLRAGDYETRYSSQEAFLEAVSMYGEFAFPASPELHATLLRRPYSAILDQGRDTLAAAILSFGSLDCAQTTESARRAALDFAAAMASGVDARNDVRQAHLYLFLCADRSGKVDEAMAAANVLRQFSGGERPGEISLDTWSKYPGLDALSNLPLLTVDIDSDPAAADVWLDYVRAGTTPTSTYLSQGPHVLAIGKDGRALSQSIQVKGPGKISLKLPAKSLRWAGISAALDDARTSASEDRPQAMSAVMAAAEADLAFVLREPGRIAVWIAPTNRGMAELVGHAPNAAIAGRLALQGLREAERAPGLDADFPLLREGDLTTTRASSSRRWWIYGAVLGAAVIGAGVIIAQDLSEDRQRIEVSLP